MAGKYDKNIKITVDDNGSLKQKTKDVNKLNKAVDKNNKKSGNLDRNMKGNAKMSANASKNFSKQAQGMQGVLVPAYAEVAARVFALTAAFSALEGAANYRVLIEGQSAYAKLTGKNMGSIAKKIQEATGFMIGFKEASTAAALGTTSGLNSKTMVRMAEVARAASVALGRDLSDSMDRLTRGIVKAEPEILDEIGIIIRLDTVYKDYAETLDTTTAKLTEYEKLQARVNAILGQGETKFGDIAAAIKPNAWSQLSAAVLDMVNAFSGFLSGPIEGVVRFLSDSKVLLVALLALITKSLVGKLGGIFKGFNKQIAEVPKKLEGVTKRIDRWKDSLGKKRAGYAERLIPYQDAEKALKNTLTGKGVDLKKTGALYAAAVGKGLTGEKFQAAVNKSLGIVLGAAKASMVDGVVTRGALKGDDGRLIKVLEQQQRTLQKGVSESSKGMKGLMGIQFLDWMTNAIASTADLGKKLTLSGLSFLNYSKQIGKTTQNVGLFNKTITNQEGVLEKQQGSLGLVLDTMKADFDKVWGKDAFAGMMDTLRTWASNVLQKFSGLSTGVRNAMGTISGTMFQMLNGLFRQSSLFSTRIPAPILKAFTTIKSGAVKLVKTLGLTAKGISGFATAAVSALVNGLQLLSFAIGAISMFSYVGRMFLDWGKFMGKASDAASSLSSELGEVNTRLSESININMKGIAGSMTGAIQSADFISAVTADISEALAKALRDIDMKAVMEDGWGNFADFFYDMFGKGLEDSLGSALGNALNAQAKLGNKLSKEMLTSIIADLNAADATGFDPEEIGGYLSKLRKGASLTSLELREFNDVLEYVGGEGLVENLELINRKLEEQAKLAERAAGNLKGLTAAFDSIDKSIKGMLKSTIPDSPFTKVAEEYSALVVLLGKEDISISNKILSIFEKGRFEQAGVPADLKTRYTNWIDSLKLAKKSLSKLKLGEGTDAEIKHTESLIRTAESEIAKLAGTIRNKLLKTHDITGLEGIVPKLFGGNLTKINDQAIALATTIRGIKSLSSKLSKADDGIFAAEIASYEAAILGKEQLASLLTKRDLDNKTPTLSTPEREDLEAQIAAVVAKQFELMRVSDKVAEQMHKQSGSVYLLSARLKNLKNDLQLSNSEWFKFKAAKIDTAFSSLRKQLDPLEGEYMLISEAVDVFNLKLGKGSEEADAAIQKYVKLNSTIGKLQTTMKAQEFTESQAGDKAYADFVLASTGAENNSVFFKLEQLKESLKRERAAKVESLTASGHTEEFAALAAENMLKAHKKITKEAEKRFKLERKTAKVNSINTRRKAIAEERVNLGMQAEHWKESSTLLELRQATAKIERDYAEEGLDFKKQELRQDEIMLAYSKLEFELFEAKRDEAIAAFESMAEAYTGVASTISTGIGDAVSNYLMDNDEDQDWRQIISQSLADSAGGLVSNIVDEQLTGRKGFIANLIPEGDFKTAIFGAEDPSVQLGKDMNSLAKMAEGAGLKVRIVEGASAVTKTDAIKDGWEWLKDKVKGNSSRMSEEYFINNSTAEAGKFINHATDAITPENMTRYIENLEKEQKLKSEIAKLKKDFNANQFNVKPVHRSTVDSLRYNKQLKYFQHPESVQDAQNWKTKDAFKDIKPLSGVQQKLPFTGPGIPTNSAASFKLLPILERLSGAITGIWPSPLTVDPMAKPYTPPTDPNLPLGNYGPTASELNDGNVLEMFWNMGLRIGEKVNEALGLTDPTGAVDKMKVPQTFEYADPYSVDANSLIGQKLESIVLRTPTLELQNAALTAAIDASNGKEGSTKVEVVNSADIKSEAIGASGVPIPTTSITGDATTNKLSTDLRASMAANLNSQIQNDNLNAKALITNSLSTVGTNLMSGAINSFFGFANGGVAKGGFRAFANGGTVKQPTLGLVGEGKYNEAVVPLPDGKSIPVIGAGGNSGDNNVTVNVTVDSNGNAKSDTQSGMDGDQAKQLGYMVSQAVQQELMQQQRPGGLLSSY